MVAVADKPRTFAIDGAVRAAWTPHERIPPHVWANRHRVLGRGYSAEPGPWRTSRTPYLAGVMDAFADPHVKTLVFVKSARVGGTESINNMVGFAIDQEPGPVLYVYPTESAAREECTNRLTPIINGSPRLREHIPHGGWSTAVELTLDSCTVYMGWAASPTSLIRRTCRYVFIDEVDNCDQQAGSLGDTVSLAAKRITTYRDRGKVVLNSTPTKPEAGAWRTYQESDRRHYHVPCPECGAYQVLRFDQLKVPKEQRDPDKIQHGDLAWYECEHCKAELKHGKHQAWMVGRGVWIPACQKIAERLPVGDAEVVARAVFDHADKWTPRITGKTPITKTAGFHIWAAYSPWVRWSEIMAEWFAVKAAEDPERRRVFINQMLGEPWEQAVEKLDVAEIKAKRKGGLPRDVVPDDALVLVAAADVQKDHIYYAIVAFGLHRTSWLVREGVVMTLDELYDVCTLTYDRANGDALSPQWVAIDSGARTHEVYEFARNHPGVYAVKGEQNPVYNVRPNRIKYVLSKTVEQLVCMLFHVNTYTYKVMLHRMLHTPDGEPGCFHLNRDTTDDFCLQLTAESLVWKTVTVGRAKRRVAVWEPKTAHTPNHFLDVMVYLLAIADFRGVLSMRDPKATATKARSEDVSSKSKAPKFGTGPQGWSKRRRR